MIDPWMLVSNDLLVDIYRNAAERKVNNGLIQTSLNEIKKRNLRIDRPSELQQLLGAYGICQSRCRNDVYK